MANKGRKISIQSIRQLEDTLYLMRSRFLHQNGWVLDERTGYWANAAGEHTLLTDEEAISEIENSEPTELLAKGEFAR